MSSREQLSGDNIPLLKLTRERAEARIVAGEQFEYCDLKGVDLTGLNLEGRKFNGSDIRGMRLFHVAQSPEHIDDGVGVKTNIRNTQWIDVIVADPEMVVDFRYADAQGAEFGFTEPLVARHERFQKAGMGMDMSESGGLYGMDGSYGNFTKTKWNNIDFGLETGYGGVWTGANFQNATFNGCDMRNFDLHMCTIEGVVLMDPYSIKGLCIHEAQISELVHGIGYTKPEREQELQRWLSERGERVTLEHLLGVRIVDANEDKEVIN